MSNSTLIVLVSEMLKFSKKCILFYFILFFKEFFLVRESKSFKNNFLKYFI